MFVGYGRIIWRGDGGHCSYWELPVDARGFRSSEAGRIKKENVGAFCMMTVKI